MALNSECNSNRDVPKTIVDPLVVGSMSGGDDGHCFIATAAYGSYLHATVRVFRSFRDTFLLSNPAERSFAAWYYRVSPPLAEAVRANDFMRAGVRVCLLPLAGFSLLCLKIRFFPMIIIL
jgi:hypothetical protein